MPLKAAGAVDLDDLRLHAVDRLDYRSGGGGGEKQEGDEELQIAKCKL